LIDAPQIESIGVESNNCTCRFVQIVPDVRFPCFVVAMKDDGRPIHEIVLDGEVQIFVSFIEEGETRPGPTTRID
jgi:hypothetical protein